MRNAMRSYLTATTVIAWICICVASPSLVLAQDATDSPSTKSKPSSAATKSTQLVSIDFNNVDIGVFVKFISDLTSKNFVVDEKVRGKVTIISPGKITVAEAYRVFLSVLEVYGYTTVKSGQITKIIPSPDARGKNIKTRLEEEAGYAGDDVVTQIIPLRYADPDEIKNLFTPLISKSSLIQAYGPTNTLIITDVQSNIRRLLNILKAIDITGVGQQIAIIPVENASAVKLVTLLQTIFQSNQRGGRRPPRVGNNSGGITFVADERTNTIVTLASEGEIDNIRQLVKSLDQETPKGQGNINVYYLEHATAEDVAKVLMDIPQKGAAVDPKAPGKPTAPVVSDKVRIAADKATNSLIITADLEDYMVLEAIIKKIDIPRAMVYLEALIMEVNATKNFAVGTEWQIGDDGEHDGKQYMMGGAFRKSTGSQLPTLLDINNLDSSNLSSITEASVPLSGSGFSLGIFGEMLEVGGVKFPTINAVVNAYKEDSDVRILSTPQVLTTDNQEAKIYVGKNVPFQTQASVSNSALGDVYNSYEYKDVGKTLKITPQISKDRMVRLVISLEITSLAGTSTDRPTTYKRTIDTTAIVQDGQTVVLGGLIDDTESASHYKIPCLGDIPGFGLLFGSKATSFDKSNLYIFLTPRVIQNPDESYKISTDKRRAIEKARGRSINLNPRKEEMPPLEELQMPAPKSDLDSNQNSSMPRQTEQIEPTAAYEDVIDDQEGNSPAPIMSESSGAVQGFTLQVASVKQPEIANELLEELTKKGYAAYIVRSEIGDTTWYRVRTGYFADQQVAAPVIERLKSDQYDPILIKL